MDKNFKKSVRNWLWYNPDFFVQVEELEDKYEDDKGFHQNCAQGRSWNDEDRVGTCRPLLRER